MVYSTVALLGLVSWMNVPIELLPDVRLPRLTVTATWPGASPESVEAQLTAPIEATVQQVRGVEWISSESFEQRGTGTARIDVAFDRSTDMDFAWLGLSERLATIEEQLPPGVGRVTIDPYVPEVFEQQSQPFLLYTFAGPYTHEALRRHLNDVVAPELAEVDGVALVRVFGGRPRRLEVHLEEGKIAALGLDATAVHRAIEDMDLSGEAGMVREDGMDRSITVVNRAWTAADVRGAVVLSAEGVPVRIGEVADVFDTYEPSTSLRRINGRSAVGFEVVHAIGANTVRVADAVKSRLRELEALFPAGSELVLEEDMSEEVRRQLTDLGARALVSVTVIFLVLLAFLRSFVSTGIVLVTIGFSVLTTLNVIYFGGMTLNLLTMMGLAMGLGLVVDNSIVVIENMYRRHREGEDSFHAAYAGARTLALPIIASTATTLIVLAPFVYLQGELRVFYLPLGVVVALTLLASLVAAFTFIPAGAARGLRGQTAETTWPRARDDGKGRRPDPLSLRFYRDLISSTVRFPGVTIMGALLAFGASYYLFDRHVRTWAAWGGEGATNNYILLQITLPGGSSLERTDQLMRHFEDRVAQISEVERFTVDVMPGFASMRVTFPDSLERSALPRAVKANMEEYSHTFTGAEVRVTGYFPSSYGGGDYVPTFEIKVLGYSYERVREIAEGLGDRLRRLSRVATVNTNAAGGLNRRDRVTEMVVRVDRSALARHGLSVADVAARLRAAVPRKAGSGIIGLGGEEVSVQVGLAGTLDLDLLGLTETLIDTPGGHRIRVGDVINLEERNVPARIRRENQQYERTVSYAFHGPVRLGGVVQEQVVAATAVPAGYTVEAVGPSSVIDGAQRAQIWRALALALLLVYMVTAGLFESLRQPLCVILTVPMALIGVYLIFFYTDAAFTREAYIGVIMMLGIVVNNAILLVDNINRVRERCPALPLNDAILHGSLERVRPILMTTTTTVLGLLPLVLLGEFGSNVWDALALVLIGGLLSSTLFVLTITPALYRVLAGNSLGLVRPAHAACSTPRTPPA